VLVTRFPANPTRFTVAKDCEPNKQF
jgi:hypothetical protein